MSISEVGEHDVPTGQEGLKSQMSPSHPRPALGLGHGGRDWLQITPEIFFFSLNTYILDTHTPLSPAHAGVKSLVRQLEKFSLCWKPGWSRWALHPVLLQYFHQHVVNLAVQPSPGCEAHPPVIVLPVDQV